MATVVTFCTAVPTLSPPVWTTTKPTTTPAARIGTDPLPTKITTYSAMTTALAAPENARVTSSSDQPATNPATGPNASRA